MTTSSLEQAWEHLKKEKNVPRQCSLLGNGCPGHNDPDVLRHLTTWLAKFTDFVDKPDIVNALVWMYRIDIVFSTLLDGRCGSELANSDDIRKSWIDGKMKLERHITDAIDGSHVADSEAVDYISCYNLVTDVPKARLIEVCMKKYGNIDAKIDRKEKETRIELLISLFKILSFSDAEICSLLRSMLLEPLWLRLDRSLRAAEEIRDGFERSVDIFLECEENAIVVCMCCEGLGLPKFAIINRPRDMNIITPSRINQMLGSVVTAWMDSGAKFFNGIGEGEGDVDIGCEYLSVNKLVETVDMFSSWIMSMSFMSSNGNANELQKSLIKSVAEASIHMTSRFSRICSSAGRIPTKYMYSALENAINLRKCVHKHCIDLYSVETESTTDIVKSLFHAIMSLHQKRLSTISMDIGLGLIDWESPRPYRGGFPCSRGLWAWMWYMIGLPVSFGNMEMEHPYSHSLSLFPMILSSFKELCGRYKLVKPSRQQIPRFKLDVMYICVIGEVIRSRFSSASDDHAEMEMQLYRIVWELILEMAIVISPLPLLAKHLRDDKPGVVEPLNDPVRLLWSTCASSPSTPTSTSEESISISDPASCASHLCLNFNFSSTVALLKEISSCSSSNGEGEDEDEMWASLIKMAITNDISISDCFKRRPELADGVFPPLDDVEVAFVRECRDVLGL